MPTVDPALSPSVYASCNNGWLYPSALLGSSGRLIGAPTCRRDILSSACQGAAVSAGRTESS